MNKVYEVLHSALAFRRACDKEGLLDFPPCLTGTTLAQRSRAGFFVAGFVLSCEDDEGNALSPVFWLSMSRRNQRYHATSLSLFHSTGSQ